MNEPALRTAPNPSAAGKARRYSRKVAADQAQKQADTPMSRR